MIFLSLLHLYRCKEDARSACRAGKKQLVSVLLGRNYKLSILELVPNYR